MNKEQEIKCLRRKQLEQSHEIGKLKQRMDFLEQLIELLLVSK